MVNKFKNKLENREYISTSLYEFINKNYPSAIPSNFDIDIYNNDIIEKDFEIYKENFKNVKEENIKKILSDDDFTKINIKEAKESEQIIISKVKYLLDIKKINSNEILIMNFNKKQTKQLEQKMYLDLNINVNINEYHELGYKYILDQNKDKKCYEVDEKIKNKIFYDYFKEYIFNNKPQLTKIIKSNKEIFDLYFIENYDKYDNYEDYFKDYKQFIISAIPNLAEEIKKTIENDLGQEKIKTLKGETAKSKGEAIIADFLTKNNIEYEYEQFSKEEHEIQKPDFTIINEQGEKIYIEYDVLPLYEEQIETPNQITINCISSDQIIKELIQGLTKYNIKHSKKTDEEIYEMILDKNPYSQIEKLKNKVQETIDIIKSSSKRNEYKEIITKYIETLKGKEKNNSNIEANLLISYYEYYQNKLTKGETFGYDYSDLMYYANLYLEQLEIVDGMDYKYIIIDKSEQIPIDKYELIVNLAKKTRAKVLTIEIEEDII